MKNSLAAGASGTISLFLFLSASLFTLHVVSGDSRSRSGPVPELASASANTKILPRNQGQDIIDNLEKVLQCLGKVSGPFFSASAAIYKKFVQCLRENKFEPDSTFACIWQGGGEAERTIRALIAAVFKGLECVYKVDSEDSAGSGSVTTMPLC